MQTEFRRNRSLASLLTACSLFVIGCGSPGSQDQPATYRSTLAQIEEHCKEIQSAFAAGTPEAADSAVHALEGMLPTLPVLAGEAGMSAADAESVMSASVELSQIVAQIHDGFHGGDSPDAAELARLDPVLETLAAKAAELK